MAYSEDHIVLAAEYALGTLDGDERAQVQTMMAVDKDFAAVVEAWEFRLSVLNQMVGLIEPRPELWERIKAAISSTASQLIPSEAASSQQSPSSVESQPVAEALPPVEPTSAASASPVELTESADQSPSASNAPAEQSPVTETTSGPPPLEPESIAHEGGSARENTIAILTADAHSSASPSNVVALASKVRRWRTVATAMTAVAAVLLALLSVQVYRPDLLPNALRAKSADAASAQYVALLQGDGTSPAFILTVDAASKNFTVRRVGAASEPGKSYELWLVSDTLQKPRSLGVIGGSDFTTRPVLSSYDADTLNRATYAVTLEPEGGSPTGAATGPIVFSGKLIETVPTAR